MLTKEELAAAEKEFRDKWLREGQDDLSDVFSQAAQAPALAAECAAMREVINDAIHALAVPAGAPMAGDGLRNAIIDLLRAALAAFRAAQEKARG